MSRRVLVTGASGFAGRHLVAACREAGDHVVGLARRWDGPRGGGDSPEDALAGEAGGAPFGADPDETLAGDLLDPEAARAAVERSAPDVVYHLAAQAHVGRSWRDPGATLHDNVALTLNLLEGVRAAAPEAAVVAVGSGEIYGRPEALPLTEASPLRPQNPYAVSKASADLLAGLYADAHGLRVIRARAFNHAGPGQEPAYAIASFARQVALAEDGHARVVTGNPDSRRDFTDVRDVAAAYRALAEHGAPGEAYNICSGTSVSIADLVSMLGEVAGVEVEHVVDPALVRAHEVMEVRGAPDRLRAATGWQPATALERTLADTVDWWRAGYRSQSAPA